MKRFLVLLLIAVSFSACQELPKLEGVNVEAWKADIAGCNEERLQLVDTIISQSDKLKGLSENTMISLLGKPDQHELYERSQKFFIYHLEKGNKCPQYDGKYFKSFYIRFNSLDQAVAFTIQEIK